LQVYSFDGADFSLEEDIYTTRLRIYDVAYDSGTDRLYWGNYDPTDSIFYYELGSTPLGYSGAGTSLGSYSERGTYGLLLDDNILYRLKGLVELLDPATGAVIQSFATDGSHISVGHGNVARFGDYLLFVDRWFTPINLSAADVSTAAQAAQVATLELSQSTSPVTSSFALRRSAGIAIAADSASGLHIADLSGLPSTISRVQLLEPADLGGLSPAGQVDCTAQCCYADNTDEQIMVLCP
jgi:hypothetical protein